jgi:hypothetical protein
LHADEDDDHWLGCDAAVLPYLEGVAPIVREDGTTTCRYAHVRHLVVGHHLFTLALERRGSEHEDLGSLEESVYFLDEQQRVFAQVEQLDIEQWAEESRVRVRRFRVTRFTEPFGYERAGLCIETVEEVGPGSLDSWEADAEGRPWRPTRRHRAVDAWVLEDERSVVPFLQRRAAYDGLCPARGYARFVDAGPRDMSNIEQRRVVGEVHLPDAIQRPAVPWRVPWPRGQHLTIADVRRAFPGHARYWWDMAGTESSPEPWQPLLCAGRGRGLSADCLVRVTLLSTEERGRMGLMLPAGERFAGEHRVRDPRFSTGLDGVQVGARYTTLAPRREDRIADCTPEQWSSCPALDVAAITEIALAPR